MGGEVPAPGSTQRCPETPVSITHWDCRRSAVHGERTWDATRVETELQWRVLLHGPGCKWKEEEEKAHPLQCLEGDASHQRDNDVVGSHSGTDLLQDARQDVGFGGQEDQGALLQHLQVAVRGPAARLLPVGRERCHSPAPPTPSTPHGQGTFSCRDTAWGPVPATKPPRLCLDFAQI